MCTDGIKFRSLPLFLFLSYTKLGLIEGTSHLERTLFCQRDEEEEDGIRSSWGSPRVLEPQNEVEPLEMICSHTPVQAGPSAVLAACAVFLQAGMRHAGMGALLLGDSSCPLP